MTDVAACDPGAVAPNAVAEFRDGALVRVYFFPRMLRADQDCPGFDLVVWEKPQADSRVGLHNIELAAAGAFFAGSVPGKDGEDPRVIPVTPTQWKGSVPKPVHHKRIWQELLPCERECFAPDTFARIRAAVEKGARDGWRKEGVRYYGTWKGHNTLDAAGLGLYALERLRP